MSHVVFHAERVVWEDPEGYCHLVGFADHADDTRDYLILQRGKEPEEQNASAGMNTYHVELCGQEHSGYGGIQSFTLMRDSVELLFESSPSHLGEVPCSSARITFELGEVEFRGLKAALESIFIGSACFHRADA